MFYTVGLIIVGLSCLIAGTLSGLAINKRSLEKTKKQLTDWKSTAEKYKKIAKSHEIVYPKDDDSSYWVSVGSTQYIGSIEDNFKKMRKDLKKIKVTNEAIRMKTEVYVIGEMTKHLVSKNWQFNPKHFGEWQYFGKLTQTYYGYGNSTDEVVDQFYEFIRSPFWGISNLFGYSDTRWALPNAPILFKVFVEKATPKKEEVKIVYVEVVVDEPKEDKDPLLVESEKEIDDFLELVKNKTTFVKTGVAQ